MEYVVALEDIYVAAGVMAHKKGDMVPVDNVKLNGWESLVAKPTTKAAQEATK